MTFRETIQRIFTAKFSVGDSTVDVGDVPINPKPKEQNFVTFIDQTVTSFIAEKKLVPI